MSSNRLSKESSAYLKGAAHQPVDWYPWSAEAFDRAKREDRPILLDIGAVWCHWCHVLDQESYDDPEVAKIINEHFVAVKVDRDARPDVDARYQQSVSAITGQGGWPLTAFLTPEGKVFYGGTYFPPQDAFGRPSFKRVLLSAASYYRDNKDEAARAAAELHQKLAAVSLSTTAAGRVDPALLNIGTESMRRMYDAANGGFGTAPKFPHPSALEFLLRRYSRTRDDMLLEMVTRTLEKMGRGGVHDQIGGGFHRYSTDARWIVPHFEKMLYDNAPLLSNYVHAYQLTGNPNLRAIAMDTAEFMATVLYDRARGGFYGSQDADVGAADDGSYFTWAIDEARAVLPADEFAVLTEHFHLQGRGEMHTGRHVLFVDKDPDVIAAVTGRSADDVLRLIDSGKRRLAEARSKRQAPYIDTAIYVNWNGMAISAFLEAFKALDHDRFRDLAIRALDRILAEGYDSDHGCVHVLGSSEPQLLDDQAHLSQALLDAYEVTGEARYLRTAQEIMALVIRDYWDDADGFSDVPRNAPGPVLTTPHVPIQDAPTPAPNAVAALVLLRLARMFNSRQYRHHAEGVLNRHAPALAPHGLFASTLLTAVDDLLHEPAHITVVGAPEDPRTAALHRIALATYRPDKVVSLVPDGTDEQPIPDAVRAMITAVDAPTAYVCAGAACALPTSDPAQLAVTIQTFGLHAP